MITSFINDNKLIPKIVNDICCSLTVSPGAGIVTAVIQGQTWNKQSCHIWTQVLDCKDGSFIIRYKLHNTCLNVTLYIKVNGQDLQIFPLKIIGMFK